MKDNTYIAHKRVDNNEIIIQSVREHLNNVADLAGQFATEFGMHDYAYAMGLAHDIGKYSDLFQRKIREDEDISVDHSTAGAKEMAALMMRMGVFGIAGHHGGIPDLSSEKNNCVRKRLKKPVEDYSIFSNEIKINHVESAVERQGTPYSTQFMIRMLFSCLVDADFLDTETFMTPRVVRGGYDSLSDLYHMLMNHISPWLDNRGTTKDINSMRTEILVKCITSGDKERGIFGLTVPTGAGKTISSMAFALAHALRNEMKRVIYVIPYTSIIEQNAAVFRAIFGDKNVIEHHANVDYDKDTDEFATVHQLSAENWDAPIVITTNVQFFESLYSNKVSQCRKLHNIANSIVIFDEAQMIPLNYFRPCMTAIKELVENYQVTALLCTATQPEFERWIKPLKVTQIVENYEEMYELFKRNNIVEKGQIDTLELVSELAQYNQVLTIVNSKQSAKEIYELLPEENKYHLSTNMIPFDRKNTIELIRNKLESGENCRVIATSLIEAGVDLDFPTVYREKAGLDSIIQAAGRCNRNGRNEVHESKVWVFEFEEKHNRFMEKNIAMTNETIIKNGTIDTLSSIKYYFAQLQNLDFDYLDSKHILEAFGDNDYFKAKMPFHEVSEKFRLIETDTKMVVVGKDIISTRLLEELRYLTSKGESVKTLIRKLGQYTVNVYSTQYMKMLTSGMITEIMDGVAQLCDLTKYKDGVGIMSYEGDGFLSF